MKEIIGKFKFRSNAVVINAPEILEAQFVALGFKTSFEKSVKKHEHIGFRK